MRHLQGCSRTQATLLPEVLDDYVVDDNPVRVIDAFINTLDMQTLGFSKAQTKTTGRKPYNPSDLLKLYVYGYLNHVRSSRRLEKECHRNLEVIWLMARLAPDFKTIADFRKDNTKAIKGACQSFVIFCREANLLGKERVAIDGSKFRSAASKDQVMTRKQVEKHRERLILKISNYLAMLDKSDTKEVTTGPNQKQVTKALKALTQKKQRLDDYETNMDENRRNQYCATEPDARLMRSGREGMVVGYNIQSAVEADSGLIIHHEVTDEAADNRQLLPMASTSKDVLDVDKLEVIADAGYSNGEQLDACESQGITATVPTNRGINNQGEHYQKSAFTFNKEKNEYTCPAGKILTYTTRAKKDKLYLYSRTGCNQCHLQSKCTKADKRWITRHFHEEAFERCEQRLQKHPELMVQRMELVEKPFAILKHVMGIRRFLCWGITGAQSEMGIAVLGYNLKRMMNREGVPTLLAALR
jgi:transposase